MSAGNILSGVKSQIPILRSSSSKTETKPEIPGRKNKKWTEKLKRRSASTLSLFNVTHKVPSHIVSPKSSSREGPMKSSEDDFPPEQYRSNLELSSCWSHLGEMSTGDHNMDPSLMARNGIHNSEHDLASSSTWWQKKAPVAADPYIGPSSFVEANKKSASVTNIYDDNMDFSMNYSYPGQCNAPMSLPPASQELKEDYANSQDLQKQLSHDLPTIIAMNSGLKTQFRSEQNLLNYNWQNGSEFEIHSLDYNYANRSTIKYSFDISTIKELPEERSDSPAKQLHQTELEESPPERPPRTLNRRPSITDKYRSLQDLRQTFHETQQQQLPMSLTASQSNILFQTIPEDDVHDIATSFQPIIEDKDCFRSFQDLRDPSSFSSECLQQQPQYSLDYHHMVTRNGYTSVQDLTKESSSNQHRSRSLSCAQYAGFFPETDLSVSMIDIGYATSGDTYQNSANKKASSKIPKRRHTITVQDDVGGMFPGIVGSQGKSFSSHNLSSLTDSKQDYLSLQGMPVTPSSEAPANHERSKSAEKSPPLKTSTATGNVRTPSATLERKNACLGCQHKRDRKPVARQHSMPHVKSRARSEEKPEGVRRPLSRSNSSPGQQGNRNNNSSKQSNSNKANSKGGSNKQEHQQRDEALTAETASDASMEGRVWGGEVARLRDEVEQQRRTIRQLTLRMPREGLYREDQPMSLGTLPSVSMDNMYEGLLRPAYNRGRSEPSPGSDWLSVIGDLREENRNLKSELQEARDQADLLEFRILELTEGSDRFSESDDVCSVKEVGASDSPRDDPSSGGSNPQCGGQAEDLSLPLSIDSGLDLTADCKKSRNNFNSATSPKGGVSSTTSLASTNGPLNHQSSSNTDITMTETSPSGVNDKMEICGSDATSKSDHLEWSNKMVAEADANKMAAEGLKSSELTELAARLQESLANADPKQQEEALLEAINKLRSLDGSLCGLQSRVVSLTEENQYLQEALSALSDAHETRTEASGTESEIVNRKTPSLHSDLSDSESDSASSSSGSHAGGGDKRTNKRLEVTSSFQESGIFDGPCEVAHAGTQTEAVPEDDAASQEDLSSAVARLTAIRSAMQGGGVHVRRQDPQDGVDELSPFKCEPGQQDSGSLALALHQTRAEKQALQDALDQLSHTIDKQSRKPIPCKRCYEISEVDKGQSNVLREQLRISESSRKTLYDEKCELEEAENDAKLMVQRLDSQLTAAREMELLLSASLSQEQEISRELHRKLKELQALEKERCLRQSVLERHSLSSVERVASLVMERDSYASQVSFVKMGLTLLQAFRVFQMANCTTTLAPYNSGMRQVISCVHADTNSAPTPMEIGDGSFEATSLTSSTSGGGASCVLVNCAIDEALMEMGDDSTVSTCSTPAFLTQNVNSSSEMDYNSPFNLDDMIISKSKFSEDFLVPGLCDMSVQTDPVRFLDETRVDSHPVQFASQQFHTDASNILDASTFPFVTNVSNVTLIDVQTSQILQDSPVSVVVEKKSKSTMTIGEDLLSQRERYYLRQIKTLQDEKMALRKDQEQERQDQLQQCRALQAELEMVQDQLAEGERQRAMLQCRLEEAREQREATGQDLHRRLEEMRGDVDRCSHLHEMEKKALRRDFDARLSEIGDDRRRCADRVVELEQLLVSLRQELEVVGVAIVTDMTGYDGQPHSAALATSNTLASSPSSGDSEGDPSSAGLASLSSLPSHRINTDGDLLDRIRYLIKSEAALRRKIEDFEQKELAYQDTLGRADQIMLNRELEFKQRIVELEEIHEQCSARIRLLEKNEDRLRSSMKAGSRSDQDDKINDLLQKIIDSEKNELALQDRLYKLEKCEKELRIKLMEGEKVQQSLRSELREQEDMLAKMRNLQAENSAITHQLQQAHNNVRRVVELQQSERFLRGRVEELETSEHHLRETLQQTENTYCAREKRLREQVSCLKEDISSFKSQLESTSMRETEAREMEVSLRKQVEALKSRLEESQQSLKESSAETISTEAQCRNEMVKLRTQLKLVNSQLSDLDGISCSLRERLAASEQLREALEQQLEERKRRHESDLLQLNLQACQRESRLEETEGQLCELTQLHAAQELDLLASSALAPMLRAAHGAAAKLKLCEACSTAEGGSMAELKTHLSTLMDLLNGAPQSDTEDNEGDDSDEDDITDAGRSETHYVTTVSLQHGSNTTFDQSSNGQLGSLMSSTSSPNHFPSRPSSSTSSINVQSFTPSSSLTSSECQSISATVYGEDNDSSAASSLRLTLSESPDSCRPGGSPVPVPAPRRKRKQKREDTASLRGSFRARKKGNTTILEELEEKVRELEESTAKKEEELRLADSEAAELNSRLQASQELAAAKEAEVCEFRRALSDLQQQLVLSIECREVNKIKLEAKFKADEESMVGRVQKLTEQLERLADRGRLKDHIIATLVTQIRAILRTTSMGVVLTQVRQIDQRRELSKLRRLRREEERLLRNQETLDTLPMQMRLEQDEEETDEEIDFDVETVCDLLNQPREMVSVSQELIIRTLQAVLQEPLPSFCSASTKDGSSQHNYSPPTSTVSCQTQSSNTDATSDEEQTSTASANGSECLDQSTQTSLLGLTKSFSGVALSSHLSRLPKPLQRSLSTSSSKVLPTVQPSTLKHTTRQPPTKPATVHAAPSLRPSVLAPVAVAPTDALVTASRHSTTSTSLGAPPPSTSLVSGDRVTSTTYQARVSTAPSTSSTAAATTSSKPRTIPGPVSRKEYGRYGRSSGHPPISDARCIKRMLTGSAPVKAPVDCFASPEVMQSRLHQEATHTQSLPLSSVDPIAYSTPNQPSRSHHQNGEHPAEADGHMLSSERTVVDSHMLSSERTVVDGYMLSSERTVVDGRILSSQRTVDDGHMFSSENTIVDRQMLSSESTKYATICVSRAPSSGLREVTRRHSMGSVSSYQNIRPGSCFSLPKWRPAGVGITSKPVLASSSTCKGDGVSCIPKPCDLRVTRRVGLDGAVIAWSPLDHDCVAGFQVIVGGRVVQQVKSPDRTKAFINGLPMTSSVTIGLISVGIDGRCSKPAVVTCDRTSVYPLRSVRKLAPTRRSAAPTCI